MSRRPHRRTEPPSAEEAAAIVAAIERFLRDSAPAKAPPDRRSPWARAALLEATGHPPEAPGPRPGA